MDRVEKSKVKISRNLNRFIEYLELFLSSFLVPYWKSEK